MKKLLILLLFVAITLCGISQPLNNTGGRDKTDYLKKSRHQKTAAWILIGGGLFCAILGSIQVNSNYGGTDNSNSHGLLIIGLAAIGGSIPLFIASSHNKKKAASVGLKNELLPRVQSGGLVYHNSPALTLKIRL